MKPKSINPSISTYLTSVTYNSVSTNIVTNFGVPIDLFGHPASEFNCFSGFTWIEFLLIMGQKTSKLIISGLDINNTIVTAYTQTGLAVMCYG